MGMGLVLPILGALVLAIAVGLLLVFFARPRKTAWKLNSVLPAIAVCIGMVIFGSTRAGSVITGKYVDVAVELTDSQGGKLKNIPVRIVIYENGVGAGGKASGSDEEGKFTLKLREGQTAEAEIHAPFPPSNILSGMPTFWTIHFENKQAKEGILELRHMWQRSLGGTPLSESYMERIACSDTVTVPVVIPAHSGLCAPALQERITKAIRTFEAPAGSYVNWGYTCRNVESIESIPWLIQVYRDNENKGASVIEGLRQTASILGDLDRASRELQRRALHPRDYNQNYVEGELRFESLELAKWAGSDGGEVIQGLQQARNKVEAQARILTDFVLSELGKNNEVVRILEELGTAAYPARAGFLQAIRSNPAKDLRGIQAMGQAVWSITPEKEQAATARVLFESDDARVVLVGCESIRNRMDSFGGAYALQRLQAVLPVAPSKDIADRLKTYISDIHVSL